MNRIGITETYDPCFVPDWEVRLLAKKKILGVKPGQCAHGCLYCFWK